MPTKHFKKVDRDGLIAEIRKAVEADGGERISMERFSALSNVPRYYISKHFANWHDALKAAGFGFGRYNDPITDKQLLSDWGRIVRTMGRMPSSNDYVMRGKYSKMTMDRRFGIWSKVPDAFRAFAGAAAEWTDVLALLPPPGAPGKAYRRKPPFPRGHLRHGLRPRRMGGRPVCGPFIDIPGLLHAPTNELGVVLLFGAMAPSLGFVVESLQPGFPDCQAKRLTRLDEWQSVRIEFEYESRNFRDHRHDPKQCDLIICWEHNWPDCPKNLEVIALGEHVARQHKK